MSDLLEKIEAHLKATPLVNSLTPLFCQILHWGTPQGMRPRSLTVGHPVGRSLTALPVAQLTGLPVFRIDWPHDRPPTVTERRAVQRALAPVHAEHLLCYVTGDGHQAAFVWPRKR
jgi:adenine-specific DNA-methyltransferase